MVSQAGEDWHGESQGPLTKVRRTRGAEALQLRSAALLSEAIRAGRSIGIGKRPQPREDALKGLQSGGFVLSPQI
jgi:hypothetical protein